MEPDLDAHCSADVGTDPGSDYVAIVHSDEPTDDVPDGAADSNAVDATDAQPDVRADDGANIKTHESADFGAYVVSDQGAHAQADVDAYFGAVAATDDSPYVQPDDAAVIRTDSQPNGSTNAGAVGSSDPSPDTVPYHEANAVAIVHANVGAVRDADDACAVHSADDVETNDAWANHGADSLAEPTSDRYAASHGFTDALANSASYDTSPKLLPYSFADDVADEHADKRSVVLPNARANGAADSVAHAERLYQ